MHLSITFLNIFTFIGVFIASFTTTVFVCSFILKTSKMIQDIRDFEGFEDIDTYDGYVEAESTTDHGDNIIHIKNRVEKLNRDTFIYNQDKFGSVKVTSFIIVVTVHGNSKFLNELIKSLRFVMGITNSLIIFCHEYYDEDIYNLISEIKFAKFTQVFYPYSTQLYPKSFPGYDSQLCTGDFNCSDTGAIRMVNYAQKKHFWWWQMNFVWDRLKVIEHHNHAIVFLEDNQVVLKDLLFLLKVFTDVIKESCSQCEIMSFGAHEPNITHFYTTKANVIIEPWDVSLFGIAFNRTVWESIKKHSYHFCQLNDHRWEVSLDYLASKRPQGQFKVFASEGPRVLRVCDDITMECSFTTRIEYVKEFAQTVHRGLFPRNLVVIDDVVKDGNFTEAGGWEDVRDQGLCMYFTELIYQ